VASSLARAGAPTTVASPSVARTPYEVALESRDRLPVDRRRIGGERPRRVALRGALPRGAGEHRSERASDEGRGAPLLWIAGRDCARARSEADTDRRGDTRQ